jgi:fucose permease
MLRAWLSPYALLTGALIFIYVGTETAISGWIAAYAQRLGQTAQSFWALASSLFWAGLLTGRAAAPALLRLFSEERLVSLALFAAIAGMTMILAGQGLTAISTGAFLAGIGLAPVFPTTLAIFTRHYGRQASQLAGVLFVMASLGGAVVPWLVGSVSSLSGELRVGLLVPLLGCGVMLALQLVITLKEVTRTED